MSFYGSGGIKTRLIDPHLDVNKRIVEFRLDDVNALYLSNLRICNLGYFGTTGDYGFSNGIGRMIDRISLYDGNTKISQQTNFSRWTTFNKLRNSNEANHNVQGFLTGSSLGFVVNDSYDTVSDTVPSKCPQISIIHDFEHKDAEDVTFNGWLDLKGCLPYLQAVPFLTTKVFKNLRVVLEYDQSIFTGADSTVMPFLVVDEMMSEDVKSKLMKEIKNVDYVEIEHDSFQVSSVEPSSSNKLVEQTNFKQIRGFNNKVVNRVVVMNEPQNVLNALQDTIAFNDGSQLCFRQKNNIRLNGRQLAVGSGINTPARALAQLTDVWGSCNVVANKQFVSTSHIADGIPLYDATLNKLLDKFDYRCFRLSERVSNLEVTFERTGVFDATYPQNEQLLIPMNARMVVHVFGECLKRLTINKDGSYLVGYV